MSQNKHTTNAIDSLFPLHMSLTAYRVLRSQLLRNLHSSIYHSLLTMYCVASYLGNLYSYIYHSLCTAYRVASYFTNLHSYIPLTVYRVPHSQLLRQLALLHICHSLRTAYRVASYLDNLHSRKYHSLRTA